MKKNELVSAALELLSDDELFIESVNELDSWNGFADCYRAYPMDELDDFFCDCKVSEFMEKVGDSFNFYDNYFYFDIYGIESTNDIYDLYHSNTDPGEVLDNLVEYFPHLWFSNDELEEVVEALANGDFEDAEV